MGIGKILKELKDIKKQVSKSEYVKITEPLNETITTLQIENLALKETINKIIRAFNDNIKNEYLEVWIEKNKLKVRPFDYLTESDEHYTKYTIPVKEGLRNEIFRIYDDYLKKLDKN